MQSNKASKKTRKAAENPAVAGKSAGEVTAQPRVTRSASSKMQETNDNASLSHRHKVVSPASEVLEQTSPQAEVREAENKVLAASVGSAQTRQVNPADVAHLAYSFFAERGYQHGHAEEDWLRAEREIRSRYSA